MPDREFSLQRVLLGLLVVAVAGTLLLSASTSALAFSPYNFGWDGTSELRSSIPDDDTRVTVARETDAYSSVSAGETVAVILSPREPYRSSEVTRIANFVRGGGTLVVATDRGDRANALVRKLGVSARFDGRPLRDTRYNYRSPAIPVAEQVANDSFVSGVESVSLNHGTAVNPGSARAVVNTSGYAYLDGDRDGRLGDSENLSSYPVVTVERVGGGRVVLVGDSSAFINAMLDLPGNRQFATALVADEKRLLLDSSHADRLPPTVTAVLVARDSPLVRLVAGVLAVGALAVWSRRSGSGLRSRLRVPSFLRRGRSESELDAPGGSPDAPVFAREELLDYLEAEHPDWDRERVERVVSAFEDRRGR